VGISLKPLLLYWFLFSHIISCFSTSVHHYFDIPAILSSFYRDPLDVLIVLISFLMYLPQQCCAIFCIMICCAENTCMSQVVVDILFHSTLVVGSYDTLMDIFLIQILLCLVLLLYTQRDLCAVYCIEVHDYTAHGYTWAT
jgi:hypothetical protein